MSEYFELTADGNPTQALCGVFKKLLSDHLADAVFAAAKTPYSELPMPSLFTQPDALDDMCPFAPAAPFNAARQAKSVIHYETGKRIALVMRPCEIRALIELVKLRQCSLENVILIGVECSGRMENQAYLKNITDHPNFASEFYENPDADSLISQACQVCDQFQPKGADISIRHIGLPLSRKMIITADSDAGRTIMERIGLPAVDEPAERKPAVDALYRKRVQKRAEHFKLTSEKINSIDKLQNILGTCLNCYNCRTACPVCYCKECVFNTDVFDHPPEILVRRAEKKGKIKLPADTVMFHLTRLAHMSHACVGCGHCSSVCPSQIPVADIFMTVSAEVQTLFDYIPGRSVNEKPPLTVFEQKSHE